MFFEFVFHLRHTLCVLYIKKKVYMDIMIIKINNTNEYDYLACVLFICMCSYNLPVYFYDVIVVCVRIKFFFL